MRAWAETIWARRIILGLGGLLFILPYLPRLTWPSLYIDDVVRVAFRQTETLGESLFRPFNEHLAPLFEIVGWVAWKVAGADLTRAATVLTSVSLLPFALSIFSLYRLARREFGDAATAAVVAAVFSLSELSNETAFWYSASSFSWALLFTILAWSAAIRAAAEEETTRSAMRWSCLSALFAFLAPCFCALGVLAGPVAAARHALSGRRRRMALVPGLGTLTFIAVTFGLKHRSVVASSLGANFNLSEGLLAVAEAPVGVLFPAVFGMSGLTSRLPGGVWIGVFLIAVIAIAAGLRRHGSARPVVLASLLLILGGYGVTYPVRVSGNLEWILTVQRYHLFPQAGIAMILGAASSGVFRRLARQGETVALIGALAVAAAHYAVHASGIQRHGRFYRYPEQPRVLTAMEEIPAKAVALGLDRATVLTALDPLRNAWTPDPRLFNTWKMLPEWTVTSRTAIDPGRALLDSFPSDQREALCGGMDVTRRLRRSAALKGVEPGAVVVASRARPLGDGRFETQGVMAFVEVFWNESPAKPTALVWSDPAEGELWWTDDRGEWSPSRSVTWAADGAGGPYSLSLDEIPHWTPRSNPRVRVLIRAKEPRIVSVPGLTR